MEKQGLSRTCYIVSEKDNVATVIGEISPGRIALTGKVVGNRTLEVKQKIQYGHKVAIHAIKKNEAIVKYGVTIGVATADIASGEHVHLHNIKSLYDERAATRDPVTAVATDMEYDLY